MFQRSKTGSKPDWNRISRSFLVRRHEKLLSIRGVSGGKAPWEAKKIKKLSNSGNMTNISILTFLELKSQ